MKTILLSTVILTLTGCAQMDAVIQPRRTVPDPALMQMGLQLLQMGRPVVSPAQIYVIDGRQIICTRMNNVVTCH